MMAIPVAGAEGPPGGSHEKRDGPKFVWVKGGIDSVVDKCRQGQTERRVTLEKANKEGSSWSGGQSGA